MRALRMVIPSLAILTLLVGCGGEVSKESVPTRRQIPSGPPRHWDVGDQTLKHKLPEDVADGYLQFARTAAMSYGLTLSHDRISARSHAGSDMLIYIHSGVARFHVGDKDFTAATGDLIFVPMGVEYSAEAASKRGLELLTFYAPPLDSNDVTYHEAAERVRVPFPQLPGGPTPIDSVLKVRPEDSDEKLFEQMQGSKVIEEDE